MPKEEKQLDVKTGRVRRKAIFEDTEDESGDEESEDDEEMCEGDRMENGSSDDEAEGEEDGAETTDCKYMSVRGSKRPKLEEQEEDSDADLPAFADSDDDLERSSGEEEAAEEADESSEDGDSSAGERDVGDSKSVGGDSGARLSAAHQWRDRLDGEKPSLVTKAALTTSDSGHCTAEEACPSEDESEASELSSEEEDSECRGIVRGKLASRHGDSGQKLESENLVDETSDIEDLLGEEEDHKEENSSSVETSGNAPHTVVICRRLTLSVCSLDC